MHQRDLFISKHPGFNTRVKKISSIPFRDLHIRHWNSPEVRRHGIIDLIILSIAKMLIIHFIYVTNINRVIRVYDLLEAHTNSTIAVTERSGTQHWNTVSRWHGAPPLMPTTPCTFCDFTLTPSQTGAVSCRALRPILSSQKSMTILLGCFIDMV